MDPRRFRKIMGRFASGVTVVTARDADGGTFGLTVSSFTSVSLHPLLVLVCVDRKSVTLPRLLETSAFAVNILEAGGAEIARRFATADRGERFAGLSWREAATESPVLEEALAWLDCRVTRTFDAGDHLVVLGEVVAGDVRKGEPLIWYAGGFRRLEGG